MFLASDHLIEKVSLFNKAIKKGGSSIRDFKNTSGKIGSFQKEFKVYQKENCNCPRKKCKGKISAKRVNLLSFALTE